MPKLVRIEGEILEYERSTSELDWNYPFDFCGSIYLLDRVVTVMEAIAELGKIKRPNVFEYLGNKAIKDKSIASAYKLCLCLNIPVLTVITVNKVQDVYETPVYDFETGGEQDVLEVMNECMREGKELDCEGYYA